MPFSMDHLTHFAPSPALTQQQTLKGPVNLMGFASEVVWLCLMEAARMSFCGTRIGEFVVF